MTASFNTWVLDNGLSLMQADATDIFVLSAQPVTYADVATYALGHKTFGAGSTLTGPTAGVPTGSRKVSTVAVNNGTITANGTAGYYAIVDTVNSRVLAAGPLSATQGVTSGNAFILPSFDLTLNSQ